MVGLFRHTHARAHARTHAQEAGLKQFTEFWMEADVSNETDE